MAQPEGRERVKKTGGKKKKRYLLFVRVCAYVCVPRPSFSGSCVRTIITIHTMCILYRVSGKVWTSDIQGTGASLFCIKSREHARFPIGFSISDGFPSDNSYAVRRGHTFTGNRSSRNIYIYTRFVQHSKPFYSSEKARPRSAFINGNVNKPRACERRL